MADKKSLTENDIKLIRNALVDILKNGTDDTKEFLSSVKEGMQVQSKNFSTVLKLIQSGLIDISKQGKSVNKLFGDLSKLNTNNADDLIKVLTKQKLIEAEKLTDIKDVLLKSKNEPIELDLKTNPQFKGILATIQTLNNFSKKLDDTTDDSIGKMIDMSDVIDETLGNLSLFHRQLEMLSDEYEKQGILNQVIGVNVDDNLSASKELLSTAASYVDIMSSLDIPLISTEQALKEYNKLKSNLESDKIDILDLEGVSFKEAASKLSLAFTDELEKINQTAQEIEQNLLSGIMAATGFTAVLDDMGDIKGIDYLGFQIDDQKTVDEMLANFEEMKTQFQDLASYNQMILFSAKEHSEIEADKLKFATELVDKHIELGKLTEDQLKTNEDIFKYAEDYLENITKEIDNLTDKEKLLFQIYQAAGSINKTQLRSVELSKIELELVSKYRDGLLSVSNTQDHIIRQAEMLVGTGLPMWLQSLIGTDKILKNIEAAADSAFNAMQKDLFNPTNPKSWFESLNTYVKTFRTSLLGAVSPMLLITAGFALLGMAAYKAMGKVKDISEQLGVSKAEAYKLYDSMLLMEGASGNIAVTQEKILKIQEKSLEKYGKLIDLSTKQGRELVEYSSLLSTAFGIATDESYEMISIFKKLGADDTMANNLATSTLHAAELAKISPKMIAKDLIEGAEEVSMYFGNMPQEAAKAVVNIRRMGSSIKKVGEQMQSTWNIEKFMTDMYEVAQLTGSEINLSGVFEAGITGDAEAFQASLLDALGSLDELNSYTPQAQKKIAESIGMSVGEMKSMVRLSEMNLDLTKEEQAALSNQLGTMGDITGMSKSDLEAKAKQFAATEAIDAAWNKITGTLARAFLPILEVVSDLLVGLSPVIDLIGLGFKLIGLAIKPFIPALKAITWLIGLASTKLSEGMQILDEWIIKGESIGNGMGEWVKIGGSFLLLGGLMISQWSKIGSLVSGIFTAPFNMLKGMAGMAGKVGKSLMGAGTSTMTSNTATTLTNTISGENVSKSITESVTGSLQDKAPNVTGNITDKLSDMVSNGVDNAKNFISESIKKLGDAIKGGLDFVKDVAVKGAQIIMEPLKVIGAGIGDVFNSILSGIGKGLSSFSPKAIIGSVALGILGGAMWLMAQSMKVFNEVEWSAIGKGLVALTGFAAIASVIGGVAPLILMGSLAIGALGASMMVFGGGLYVVSIGLDKLSETTDKIIVTMSKMTEIDPNKLIAISAGITAIGASLFAFNMMSAAGGLASLFTGDPVSQLVALGKTAPAISLLATSFMLLVEALKQYSEIGKSIPVANIQQIETVSRNINTNLNNVQPQTDKAIPSIKSSVEQYKETEVKESNKETNYINNQSNKASNGNIEKLLMQLISVVQEGNRNPVPAVLGDGQIPGLAKKIKVYNNR